MKKKIDQTVTWDELCAAVEKLSKKRVDEILNESEETYLDNCACNMILRIRQMQRNGIADQLPQRLFELCETNTPEIGETID